MKIDVVINFYRKHALWPLVRWGLEQNRDCVERVIVVNDEPWGDTKVECDFPLTLLDHPHTGCGIARSINQGAAEVTTEYWLNLDADIILAPGSLARNLEHAQPGRLVYGLAHDVDRDLTLAQLPTPPIERPDFRLDPEKQTRTNPEYFWWVCRDLYVIHHTESDRELGGRNEQMRGYGAIDYEYACRHVRYFGPTSYVLGRGESYHVGGQDRPQDKAGKHMDPNNILLFVKAFEECLWSLRLNGQSCPSATPIPLVD